MKKSLILASSSPFRKQLLQKFKLPFQCFSPDIDESVLVNETPNQLVTRLSYQKAVAATQHFQQGLVIGSDQVAVFQDRILGKPHHRSNAIEQLQMFSGQSVRFLTGLCVYDIETGYCQQHVEPFDVHFKSLTLSQIEAYCDIEQPYQCAGSFKSEGLGICLFEQLSGRDPNALIGLPLIQLSQFLSKAGLDVLSTLHHPAP